MRHRRIFALVAVGIAAFIGLAGPAAAQYADPDGPVAVDDTTPAPGDGITISGSGFAPLSLVDVYVFSTPKLLGSVRTDATGSFSVTVVLPSDLAAGSHTVQAIGLDPSGSERVLSTPIAVPTASGAPAPSAGGSALPRTGAAIGSLTLVGIGLIAAGSAARRRGQVRT